MSEPNGFDKAAKQWLRNTTTEGLDLGLERVLFSAIIEGNMPIDRVIAALKRWEQLVGGGYFELQWREDGSDGDMQFPATREGREFMEKLTLVRIDADGRIDEARQ
jgi:hypothetical protein